MEDNKINTSDKAQLLLFFSFALVITIAYILLIANIGNITSLSEVTKTGALGDSLNGLTAPALMLLTAYLTFLAFKMQFDFNKQQKTDIERERLENKFYKLLDLHKDNLHETKIGGYDSRIIAERKAFVSMYKEFRYIHAITRRKYLESKCILSKQYTEKDLIRLSYIFFYFGVGTHSDQLTISVIGSQFEELLWKPIHSDLSIIHIKHKKLLDLLGNLIQVEIIGDKVMLPKSYRPFGGHMSRLSHYYRHMYQAVKFVGELKSVTGKEKMDYLKTLRAQLSDHEQILLFLNVISFGEVWIENQFISKYKFIHNIPLGLLNFLPLTIFDEIFGNDNRFKIEISEDGINIYKVKTADNNWVELFEWQE